MSVSVKQINTGRLHYYIGGLIIYPDSYVHCYFLAANDELDIAVPYS